MEVESTMNDPIKHLETLTNNPFIFASALLAFCSALGSKKHSLLLVYLVLPIALHKERRKFLRNAKSTSNLRTMVGRKGLLNALPEMVADYRAITNVTLQYLISDGAISVNGDQIVVAGVLEGLDAPPPAGLEKATTALARFFLPYDAPMIFRMVGVLSL